MAGHSQFKNIMHRKGRQDAAKSKVFSKLAREITVAAKMGVPDPTMNPRLRLAIQNAKAESMPKDNIHEDRAQSLMKLVATLEDDDDVQNVYANFEVDDATLARLSAA